MKFALLLFLFFAGVAQASPPSPVGTWRVINKAINEAEALVTISEKDGLYEGKITWIFPREGVDPAALCELCPGERKNQPIEGLTIITNMHQDENEDEDELDGGEILDPDTGKIYGCIIKLSEDRQKLFVRGFIDEPFLGRTETWIRESEQHAPQAKADSH